MEILHSYECASGQMINTQKSSISFSSKTPPDIRARVKAQLGIEREGGVGKYLGLPEHFGRRKKDLFASIVDRMKQKAISWTTHFLSTAGKATMLQAVLSATPSFAMSCFELPVSLCKRIQSVLTRFWWDDKEGERKISWISWDKMTLPKGLGGLGFRDIQAFNHALLAKISWRILTKPDCLLARVLLGKYCHKASFLKTPSASAISHGWRGILAGRDLLLQHLGKAIGDGESTNLWTDSWINPETNLKPIGPVFLIDKDLMVADVLSREKKEWNEARINNLLPELATYILALKPSLLGAPDTFIWPLDKSGQYTVRSGYYSVQAPKYLQAAPPVDRGIPWNWKKFIWTPELLPKLKFFLWKAAANALPTGANLQTRGLLNNTNCIRCGARETIDHILFHCSFAREVWENGPWRVAVLTDDSSSFKPLIESARNWHNLPPYGITSNAFPWFCWNIWTSRNQLIFEKRVITPHATALKAILSQKEWEQAQANRPSTALPVTTLPRIICNEDTVFCNTDAAWRSDRKAAGLSWIFTDRNAQELHKASTPQANVSSACMAEALAIREALIQASSLQFTNICLRTDSQVLVRAITTRRRSTELYGILSDIDSLAFSASSPFHSCSFTFTPRACNGPADFLAKSCLVSYLGLRP